MGDILLSTVTEIVSDEIKRQAKQRKKNRKSNDKEIDIDFVSLLAMPKPHFDWYIDSLKRSAVSSKYENQDLEDDQNDIESSKVAELERMIDFEDMADVKKNNNPLKSKVHRNKTKITDKWEYKEFDEIVRSDDNYQIYYRTDQTSPQKLIDIDSTVVLKSNIEKKIKALSSKQLPDIYDLQFHIKDTLVDLDSEK